MSMLTMSAIMAAERAPRKGFPNVNGDPGEHDTPPPALTLFRKNIGAPLDSFRII